MLNKKGQVLVGLVHRGFPTNLNFLIFSFMCILRVCVFMCILFQLDTSTRSKEKGC